ncbi:hypothetical protein ACH36K_11300 [Clostridium sp. MB05]|uniref:hypothetical protein n=1 Tax=Clostridium sp. MB05 TaxID=3376682 RepID=UPI003982B1DB
MGIKAIKKNEFNMVIKLKFENILEGFDNYKYVELYPRKNKSQINIENDFINTLEDFFYLNSDKDKLIIDFYKNKLNSDSIKYIESYLNYDEKELFHNILNEGSEEDIFFEITDKRYIKLLTKLCVKELFFITFYFTKGPITLWGNYNLKFPLFYCNEYSIQEYLKIARDNDLL